MCRDYIKKLYLHLKAPLRQSSYITNDQNIFEFSASWSELLKYYFVIREDQKSTYVMKWSFFYQYLYNRYERGIFGTKRNMSIISKKTFIITVSTTANLKFAVISGVLKLVKLKISFFQLLERFVRNFLEKIMRMYL